MGILSYFHWIRFFIALFLHLIIGWSLVFLKLFKCRVSNKNILLFKISIIINWYLIVLFNYIIWLWHWKISFIIIFRRINIALSIFLALGIWRCHNHTFTLYDHLLILFLHRLQFLLKNLLFINVFLVHLLSLQCLAEWILVLKILNLIILKRTWKNWILYWLIVLLYINEITYILTICVFSLAL
jgi:hypothetical protein